MGRKSKTAELRIHELETLTVNGAIRILNGTDEKRKFLLIRDLAGKVLARRIKLGGEGMKGEIVIKIEKAGNENHLQAPRFAVPDLQ